LSKPQEGEFDVATARPLFQVLSSDQCGTAAKKKYRRGFREETLFISGVVIDDSRLSPEFSVGMNLIFLNLFDNGQAYTRSRVSSLANPSWIC
jgi:hypothetical protein